jgi:peptidoglycan/xylan/chitin deacetylase (PgdA/CDA1 family)
VWAAQPAACSNLADNLANCRALDCDDSAPLAKFACIPTALLYHALAELPAHIPAEQRSLFVDPEIFAWQLAELGRRGFSTLTLDEFHKASSQRRPLPGRVMVSFDDAYSHVFDVATPLLHQHGFTAVMFVPSAHLDAHNDWDDDARLRKLSIASAAQVEEAAAGPWEIGSHGFRHVDLRDLDSEERIEELVSARATLTELVGLPIRDLAYPYGRHDAGVRQDAMAAGYRMAFTAGSGDATDLFTLPRRGIRGQEGEKAFLIKASHHFSDVFR